MHMTLDLGFLQLDKNPKKQSKAALLKEHLSMTVRDIAEAVGEKGQVLQRMVQTHNKEGCHTKE